jgi:Flp pilus assembly protein TadG
MERRKSHHCTAVNHWASRLRATCVDFWRNAQGVAAIELGMLAPVLLLMLLGILEVARAVNADRHFTGAVATAGDLVAREEFLGNSSSGAQSTLDSMMQSIAHLMLPYDATSLKLAIFSVRASTTDASNTKVSWGYSFNGKSAPAKCSGYALPANLVPKGGSVIVVEAEYQYKSLFGSYVPGFSNTMTWTDKTYHNPRNSCVDYVKGDNCTDSC